MRFPQPSQDGQQCVLPRQIALEAEATLTNDQGPGAQRKGGAAEPGLHSVAVLGKQAADQASLAATTTARAAAGRMLQEEAEAGISTDARHDMLKRVIAERHAIEAERIDAEREADDASSLHIDDADISMMLNVKQRLQAVNTRLPMELRLGAPNLLCPPASSRTMAASTYGLNTVRNATT